MAIILPFVEIFSIVFLVPGAILFIIGIIFLFRHNRLPAFILLPIGFLLLAIGFALLGWSLYESNVYCPTHPAECG